MVKEEAGKPHGLLGGGFVISLGPIWSFWVTWTLLGQILEATISSGVKETVKDPSTRSTSQNGTVYFDRLRPYSELSFDVEFLDRETYYSNREILGDASGRAVIVDLHASGWATQSARERVHGCFYGHLEKSLSAGSLKSAAENSLGLSFSEARG